MTHIMPFRSSLGFIYLNCRYVDLWSFRVCRLSFGHAGSSFESQCYSIGIAGLRQVSGRALVNLAAQEVFWNTASGPS